jgi:hypothetical protein
MMFNELEIIKLNNRMFLIIFIIDYRLVMLSADSYPDWVTQI